MQMASLERFAAIDRAWLMMDRPTNPLLVVGLLILSRPIVRASLRELISKRFLKFERFRCYPTSDSLGASWVPAPHFDIDAHVLATSLPAPAGQAELEDLVGELASTPFNPSRPLWSFHLVERFRGGSAVIVRVHHCYADGIALVHVLLSLTDAETSESKDGAGELGSAGAPTEPSCGSTSPGALHSPIGLLSQGSALIEKGVHYALHPGEATTLVREVADIAGELARLGTMADDPPTRLKRPLSGLRQVAWATPLSLEEVRTIGRVLGCTVNDVLVATLAGAMGRYLESLGDRVDGQTIRAAVPVNLRSKDAAADGGLGNQFGLVFVELPIGIRHPLERLYAVHSAMQTLKASAQAATTFGLLTAVGCLPAAVEPLAVAVFSAKASLVASNVPGPARPLRLAGARIAEILFWVPQAGSIGTGVSMLSYNGRVQFGVIADRQMIPDPRALIALTGEEFERLVLLVLLGAIAL